MDTAVRVYGWDRKGRPIADDLTVARPGEAVTTRKIFFRVSLSGPTQEHHDAGLVPKADRPRSYIEAAGGYDPRAAAPLTEPR